MIPHIGEAPFGEARFFGNLAFLAPMMRRGLRRATCLLCIIWTIHRFAFKNNLCTIDFRFEVRVQGLVL